MTAQYMRHYFIFIIFVFISTLSFASHHTLVLRCDGLTVVARQGAGEMAVFVPSGYTVLSQYSYDEFPIFKEGGIRLQRYDNYYSLSIGDVEYPNCVNDRKAAIWQDAKLSGVDYRAVGNEPGWVMALGPNNRLSLKTHYGEHHYQSVLPQAKTNIEAKTTEYSLMHDQTEITVLITGERCIDTMSGDEFLSRVELNINGERLMGCGKALH